MLEFIQLKTSNPMPMIQKKKQTLFYQVIFVICIQLMNRKRIESTIFHVRNEMQKLQLLMMFGCIEITITWHAQDLAIKSEFYRCSKTAVWIVFPRRQKCTWTLVIAFIIISLLHEWWYQAKRSWLDHLCGFIILIASMLISQTKNSVNCIKI